MHRGQRARDDVGLHLEAVAQHTDRVPHALLTIDHEVARNHVDDLAVRWDVRDARGDPFEGDLHRMHRVVGTGRARRGRRVS